MSKDIDLTHYFQLFILCRLIDGQKVFKTLDFLFLITLNNIDQFQRSDFVFECQMLVFEWKGLGLESFRNYTSLYIYGVTVTQPTAERVSQPA